MMKKRRLHTSDAAIDSPRPEESSLVAWEQNPQARALRVDLQSGEYYVFPYIHFGFARFERAGDRETLQVSFATHDICVSGHHLREVGLALQKLAVDWIREAPARYAGLTETGSAFIERIDINEASEGKAPAG
jgi:hypothetical protein